MRTHIKNVDELTIIPDVRFESEASMIREEGILIHILGDFKIESSHISEKGIEINVEDLKIINEGTLTDYYKNLESVIKTKLL